jgi:hypothetical protein
LEFQETDILEVAEWIAFVRRQQPLTHINAEG